MTRWPVLALLALCQCGGTEGSGSSVPPAERSIVGGVLVSPGNGGVETAETLAHQSCQQSQLAAQIGRAATTNGATTLQYTCQ